jgi:hypothetical protein
MGSRAGTADSLSTVAACPNGSRRGWRGSAPSSSTRWCVQDGFELYLHGFIVAADGAWTVVQQGMNGERGQARRYHWLSESVRSFEIWGHHTQIVPAQAWHRQLRMVSPG